MVENWQPWSIRARNLPEHAGNPIHTDEGARAAGFPAALVAGVTTYGYLTHPVVAAWEVDWVRRGAAEIRFRAPVFDGDLLDCVPRAVDDLGTDSRIGSASTVIVEGRVAGADPEVRATLTVQPEAPAIEPMRAGEPLAPVRITLEGALGASYARRAGDDLEVFERRGIVHPAVWPALANHVVHTQVARGSWVHTRSRIAHAELASEGSEALIEAMVVDRVDRPTGERAILDVRIVVDGVLVAALEHEAIIALPA